MYKNFLVITGIELEQKTLLDREVVSGSGYGKYKSKFEVQKYIKFKPDCIISFGFAGSTSKRINCPDIIIPKKILSKNGYAETVSEVYKKFFEQKLGKSNFKNSNLYSSDQIVNSTQKKKTILKKFDASAVDMESASIQKVANKNNIPFVCIRVILDNQSTNIPKELDGIINKKSKVSAIKLFRLLIYKPLLLFSLMKISFYFFKSYLTLRKVSKNIFEKKLL